MNVFINVTYFVCVIRCIMMSKAEDSRQVVRFGRVLRGIVSYADPRPPISISQILPVCQPGSTVEFWNTLRSLASSCSLLNYIVN